MAGAVKRGRAVATKHSSPVVVKSKLAFDGRREDSAGKRPLTLSL